MNDTHEALPNYFLKLSSKLKQYSVFLTLIFLLSITSAKTLSAAEKPAADILTAKIEIKPKEINGQKLWDKSCFTCHGDSGDIARNFLKVVDGELQGPLHKDTFRHFLTNHYLNKEEAGAIYSMLLTKATTKSQFEQECSSCHKNVIDFVSKSFDLRDGVLFSKKLEAPTYGFLLTHKDLSKKDVGFFMKQLTLIAYEIYHPFTGQ